MSNTDELKGTAVSGAENIDALKVEEREKLAAAEVAYTKKTAVSGNGTAPEDAYHEHPQDGRTPQSKAPWIPGVILIGLGVIFLLNNTTGLAIDNWWALFIMIPAIGSFSKAAESVRSQGEFTREAWGGLAGGLIFTLLASAFLFDLNWGLIWPVFLIIGGLGMFLGAWRSW